MFRHQTSYTSVLSTVETISITVTDTTLTQTTIDATTTNTIISTISPAASSFTGIAQIYSNGASTGSYVTNMSNGGLEYATTTTVSTDAIQLTLSPNGQLFFGSKVAKGADSLLLALFWINPTDGTSRTPYTCSKDADGFLTCIVTDPTADLVFGLRTNNLIYVAPRSVMQNQGIQIIQLQLV
ncbi:hypothetical protein ABW20_dc0101006 [Dactylellina cionopaga]|nr:hypothetical protein ABW20_dc0101006 [Dactylellina cionopaga]